MRHRKCFVMSPFSVSLHEATSSVKITLLATSFSSQLKVHCMTILRHSNQLPCAEHALLKIKS